MRVCKVYGGGVKGVSVVVVGMEIPCNCHVCVGGYGGFCAVAPAESDGICPDQDRPDWCPLRPLPEKHGRLIDGDELHKSFRESVRECHKWIDEMADRQDEYMVSLSRIVEAEGEDG